MSIQTWKIDNTHSSIGFTVRHMVVAKVHGRFTRYDGTVTVNDDVSAGQAEVVIDASSIDTQVEARDNHLRSADFFDVERFPQLRFRSTRVERLGGDRYRVFGELSLRDITREVALETELLGRVTDPFGTERLAFTAQTSIDRREFGLTWNKAIETGGLLVADRIDIQLDVQLVKAAAEQKAA